MQNQPSETEEGTTLRKDNKKNKMIFKRYSKQKIVEGHDHLRPGKKK